MHIRASWASLYNPVINKQKKTNKKKTIISDIHN